MANIIEIADAVEAAQPAKSITLLHCTSEYPASVRHARLKDMVALQGAFPKCMIGLSDHTIGVEIPIAAVAMGARVIEKHLKLVTIADKSEDDAFSLTPDQFKNMVEVLREVYMGCQNNGEIQSAPSRQFRRSLYAIADIKRGEAFTEQNIRSIRPGYGLPPKELPNLLGKTAKRDFRRGDPLAK